MKLGKNKQNMLDTIDRLSDKINASEMRLFDIVGQNNALRRRIAELEKELSEAKAKLNERR